VKVLLNSDIAYSQRLRTDLGNLTALATACKERSHDIALPLTTVLEFERSQTAIADQERTALTTAAATLDRYRIAHEEFKVDDLIRARGLDDLFRDAGAKVEVILPTIEDFNDAHRRASLHLSPQAPNDKGEDEMRDLVIWAVSIRVAKQHGGALLLSRDKIHTGELGKGEASSAKLSVVPSVDDALRFLKIETPDAKLFIELLAPVWKELPAQGLAVTDDVSVVDVRNARFVRGPSGVSFALATVHLRLQSGAEKAVVVQLRTPAEGPSAVHVFDTGDIASLGASAVASNDEPVAPNQAYQEGLERLRKLLGDTR
jgi:hypothetical protein